MCSFNKLEGRSEYLSLYLFSFIYKGNIENPIPACLFHGLVLMEFASFLRQPLAVNSYLNLSQINPLKNYSQGFSFSFSMFLACSNTSGKGPRIGFVLFKHS